MRRVVLHIIAALLKIAAMLLRIVPVKKRVAFMSRQSAKASLDFKLLIDWVKVSCPGVEVKTCLASPETKGTFSFAMATIRQLLLSQTSAVVIVDGYVPAVSIPPKRSGIFVIQLWHAMGAIKKFGYQCLDTSEGRDGDSARILRMHCNYDCVVAGGPWAVEPLAQAFNCQSDIIVDCGLPRMDYLISPEYEIDRQHIIDKFLATYPRLKNNLKTILYAPTFRRTDMACGKRLFKDVCRSFEGLSVNLVYSGHPLREEDLSDCAFPDNVIVGNGFDTLDWLLLADVMITDYSAVAYEAAIRGVSVYFYVPDIENYTKSPGLNVDLLECYPDCSSQDMDIIAAWAMNAKGRKSSFTLEIEQKHSGCPKDIVNMIDVAVQRRGIHGQCGIS